jgi:hypothetical protein
MKFRVEQSPNGCRLLQPFTEWRLVTIDYGKLYIDWCIDAPDGSGDELISHNDYIKVGEEYVL